LIQIFVCISRDHLGRLELVSNQNFIPDICQQLSICVSQCKDNSKCEKKDQNYQLIGNILRILTNLSKENDGIISISNQPFISQNIWDLLIYIWEQKEYIKMLTGTEFLISLQEDVLLIFAFLIDAQEQISIDVLTSKPQGFFYYCFFCLKLLIIIIIIIIIQEYQLYLNY